MMERILGPLPSHMIKKSRSVLNNSVTNYAICGLNLLLVLSFAMTGFSPGTLVSPLLKNQHFQLQPEMVDKEPLCGCATCKSLFFIYFIVIYLLKYNLWGQ